MAVSFIVVGPGGFPGTKEQVERLFPVVMLAWFAGPSAASLLLTGFLPGSNGPGASSPA